jgi:tetratricopeptide (TPR) repeat protein
MNPPGSGWAHKLLRVATGWIAPTLLSFAFAQGAWAAPDAAAPKPAFKLRNPDENIFSDLRPAATDLGLAKTTENKADAEAAFIQALLLEDEGDNDGALAAYTKALQLDPGADPDLAIRVASEYANRDEIPSGIDVLKDLVKARPNEVQGLLALSDLYLRRLKKPYLAESYAEQALKIAPNQLNTYQTLFEVYLDLKRKKDAEAILVRAQKLNGDNAGFWLTLASLGVRLYTNDKGVVQAPRNNSVVQPYLEKAAELAGKSADTYSKIGDTYAQIDQVPAAINCYVKALELSQGDQEIEYKLAESFAKAGQRDEAIKALEDLIRSNPLLPEIYEFVARLYQTSKNFERALENYQQALLLAPNRPENYLHTAGMQLELKKYDDAIATLTEARHRFRIPQITYSLAIALSTANRFSDALPVYEAALQEARDSQQDILDAAFYFNYGVCAEQGGFIEKAAALLQKSIELDPSKAAQAYNYIGYMWVDRSMNLEDGGNMIRKALELEPNNAAYIDSLGWYYYHVGDYSKALTELLRAADTLKPEDPVVFEHVGDTFQALGKTGEAQVYWQKALKLDPNNQKLSNKLEESKAKLTSNPSPVNSPLPPPKPSPTSQTGQ